MDENGNGVWRYDGAARRYIRFQDDGTHSAKIDGQFLPDPEELWQKRCDTLDVSRASDIGMKLKPQAATFALWNHWQKVQNAHTHH